MISGRSSRAIYLRSPDRVVGYDCFHEIAFGFRALLGGSQRFIVRADEKLTAFVELERQVLTVMFYLESIHADFGPVTNECD